VGEPWRGDLVDGISHECIKVLSVSFKHFFRQPPENEQGCNVDDKGTKEREGDFDFDSLSIGFVVVGGQNNCL
jgi:hypothetical protein